jgi:hypothetical protein
MKLAVGWCTIEFPTLKSIPSPNRRTFIHTSVVDVLVVLAPISLPNVVPALVIAFISLAYLEEDGLLLLIALLAAIIVLVTALIAGGRRCAASRTGRDVTWGKRRAAHALPHLARGGPLSLCAAVGITSRSSRAHA